MVTTRTAAWDIAAQVVDPELPVLTIADLGVLRAVTEVDGGVQVDITPTYSGCPAIEAIRTDIEQAFTAAGYSSVTVRVVLAPAWTTDWMSEAGRQKLNDYGIAPPQPGAASASVSLQLGVRCPRCGSLDTREITRFGSTSCKALYTCTACLEPFDHFKVH